MRIKNMLNSLKKWLSSFFENSHQRKTSSILQSHLLELVTIAIVINDVIGGFSWEDLRAILQESEAKSKMKNINSPPISVWR